MQNPGMQAWDISKTEKELADRARRFLKAELKRAEVTHEELARRLREHGLQEPRRLSQTNSVGVPSPLRSSWVAELEMEGIRLEDL